MNKDTKIETHPSYGQAVFCRTSGNEGRLYGSPLQEHHQTIRLTVSRSETRHELGRDWRHATEQLIEVTFSAAQFADLLTMMNVGEGVPCTIDWVTGEGRVPRPVEEEPVEHEKIVKAFEGQIKGTVDTLRANLADLRILLTTKSLSKDDKEKIEWVIGKTLQDVESNAPFMLEQFGESTEKVITAARAEMAATVRATVEKLGIERLDQLKEMAEPKAIEARKCNNCGDRIDDLGADACQRCEEGGRP